MYVTVWLVNFEGLKFCVLFSFPYSENFVRYFISWRPFNYTGVVGVKFRDFNPTTKLMKFKHLRNLPTVQTVQYGSVVVNYLYFVIITLPLLFE